MLRLSIIVPHLDDTANLEQTLVSLLENRSNQLEIIVVHKGTYTDPYNLAGDEVVMVEAPPSFGASDQINLALKSAKAPAVQILFPGTEVSKGWYRSPLELLDEDVVCVAVSSEIAENQVIVSGLDRSALPHRRLAQHRQFATHQERNVAPLLGGSLFCKRTLELVGGLCPNVSREGAEVELQLLFDAMELKTTVSQDVSLRGSHKAIAGMDIGYETGRVCGQIACAYGAVEGSGVEVDSLAKQLSHLAGGLMNPKTVAERLGWVMGIRDRTYEKAIRTRLVTAAERLDAESTPAILLRRAA